MESSASSTFYKEPPYMDYTFIFIENLNLHFYDFSKILPPPLHSYKVWGKVLEPSVNSLTILAKRSITDVWQGPKQSLN